MYASSSADKGLSYRPYLSDGEKYKRHFSVRQNYDCSPFHLLGPVSNLSPIMQTGEGETTIKLISPTEGALERAEEDKKREDKEVRKRTRIQSAIGGGKSKVSKSPSKKAAVKSVKVAGTSKVKKAAKAAKSKTKSVQGKKKPATTRSKTVVKKSKPKAKSKPKTKTVLKRKK